ncbi:hypothetical protein FACS189447_03100 [Spirochaetia bacterium]|nr:hypothetical protein FACS189447_03100 [Spirochaetia bacterium]
MQANIGDRIIIDCKDDEVIVISKAMNGGLRIEAAMYVGKEPRPDMIIEEELRIAHRGYAEIKKSRVRATWEDAPIGDCTCGSMASLNYVPDFLKYKENNFLKYKGNHFQVICPVCNKKGAIARNEMDAIENWNSGNMEVKV